MKPMPMRVLLADREPQLLRLVRRMLGEIEAVEIVGTAEDGDMALEEARRASPDLVILGAELPGRDGIPVAAALARDGGPLVVVLAESERHAVAAFGIEAVDYLIWPLGPARLREAVDRARRRQAERRAYASAVAGDLAARSPTIHIPGRFGSRRVPADDVIRIEAARDYVLVHTPERRHIMRATMSGLAERLPETILRVHRSAFVGVPHVRRWAVPVRGSHCLLMTDGAIVAVGPSYRGSVREALSLN